VKFFAASDVGLVRKRNEDYFVISEERDLVVLCDGMGGHPGGDIASRMAAEQIRQAVESEAVAEDVPLEIEKADELRAFLTLLRGIFVADHKLREYGDANPEYRGMGTTVVALQHHQGHLCAAHVGDSRIYVFRNKKLEQITNDHSVVATHPEYAHLAGMKNILTRAMGVGEDLEVDFRVDPADVDDLYLLCTDGLTNFVTEERITEVLNDGNDHDRQIKVLVEDAKKNGGGDNITLALVTINETTSAEGHVRGTVKEANRQLTVLLEPGA
jgi:serine/threonine protein phosphatase PrpC